MPDLTTNDELLATAEWGEHETATPGDAEHARTCRQLLACREALSRYATGAVYFAVERRHPHPHTLPFVVVGQQGDLDKICGEHHTMEAAVAEAMHYMGKAARACLPEHQGAPKE